MAPPLNAKKWVEANRQMFDNVIGHNVRIKLNGSIIATDSNLNAILPTKLGELENPPEKRSAADGKQYTPPCFTLVFDQGKLVFAIEDTAIRATIHEGVKLLIGENTIELEATDANN